MPGKRSISEEEQPFNVNNSGPGVAGTTKHTERFDLVGGVVEFHSFSGTPGSFDLEGTVDGNNWTKIQTGVVGDTLITLSHYWRALRVHTVAVGAPEPPTVALGAHELLY